MEQAQLLNVTMTQENADWLYDFLRSHLNTMLIGQQEKTRDIMANLIDGGVTRAVITEFKY